MIWTVYDYRPSSGDVLDVRAANRWVAQTNEFAAVGLGEHALQADVVSEAAKFTEDAGAKLTIRRRLVGLTSSILTSGFLYPTTEWKDAKAGLEATVNTTGGLLYIIASFNVTNPTAIATGIGVGLAFALAVDGVILNDSIVGGADTSNDLIEGAPGVRFNYSGAIPVVNGSGPGVRAMATPLVLHGVVRLPPGSHDVTIRYRNVEPCDTNPVQFLRAGELIILELNA